MLNLPGYLIRSKIHVGTDTLIYSGIRNSDGAQVVVKVFKSELPRSRDLARLRHEYAILRNLDLPGVDGLRLLGMLRRRLAPHERLDAIALTARSEADAEARCREAGFDDFLRKPATSAGLFAALDAAAARCRSYRAAAGA